MTLDCKCGFKQIFEKKLDSVDYRKAGWITYGFNINENRFNWVCKKCAHEFSDNLKLLLNIKE